MNDFAAALAPLTGPGWPLNADARALAAAGYVEQEFVLSGEAHRYRLPEASRDAERLAGTHRYATRLLVRRPRDPARFSGTVVVEWLNVSTGQDVDFVYAATRELLLRQGDAWLGLSAQRVGVEQLVRWNPARYQALGLSAPETDPATGSALDPTDAFVGATGGDVLCWDVCSQAGALVRRDALQLFGTTAVVRVIAAGESQAAFRLTRYYNSLQPLHRAYDGFLLYDRGGPVALRTDVPAKVISIGTEFMSHYLGAPSPDDSEHLRWWELAGAAHVSRDEIEGYVDPQVRRDGSQLLDGRPAGLSELLASAGSGSDHPMWSDVPNGDLMKAALHGLTRWLAGGPAPRSAPRMVVGAQRQLERDPEGRVLGGIRHPAYDAPSAVNVGFTEGGCRLAGYHFAFTADEMRRRYGDGQAYLARVQTVVQANLAAGFLLPEEAERVMREAQGRALGWGGAG